MRQFRNIVIKDVKTVVDTLLSALNLRSEILQRKRKRKLILDLLTAYYCFSHIVKNGKDLLSIAGEEPIRRVTEMPEAARLKYGSSVYSMLLTQRLLLMKLDKLIKGQPIMELFDPKLKQDIEDLNRSKGMGLIAAASDLETYFWGERKYDDFILSDKETATYGRELAKLRYQANMITLILSGRSRIINIEAAQNNLNALEEAANSLRLKISELVP
jgi:hypothetical protein